MRNMFVNNMLVNYKSNTLDEIDFLNMLFCEMLLSSVCQGHYKRRSYCIIQCTTKREY